MTRLSDAARYEMQQAIEATVTGFKAAQERHGLDGLWFPLDEAWEWFSGQTTFKQDMQDFGYAGDHRKDLSLLKQYSRGLKDADLYIAPRQSLMSKARTSVWTGRSKFLQHIEARFKIPGYRGAKTEFDRKHLWLYALEEQDV